MDPAIERKTEKFAKAEAAANSFEAVAREWWAKNQKTWAASYAEKVIRRFERDLFPWLGGRPVGEIEAPELLQALRRVEARGHIETAHRELRTAGQIFRYPVATGRAKRNPATDIHDALAPWQAEHYAALTEPADVAELMRTIDGYQGAFTTKAGLQLLALVFTRPGELRKAEWAEFSLDAAEWRIPAERMKTKAPHIVPLATQAVAILRALAPLTGRSRYVFPSVRTNSRPMSENTLNAALEYMGYGKDRMRAHGFRATARTMLDEQLGFRADFIEHQLAHNVRDPLGRAYNRTKHLPERRKMMQAWADYLDSLKAGANVVALHTKRGA